MPKKELLVIAYYYPPMPSVAAQRMRNIVSEGKKAFNKVHVLSSRNALHFGPVQDPDVHSIPTMDYRSIALNQFKREELHFGGKHTSSKGKNWLGRLLSTWPMQFTLGEGGGQYIWLGRKKANEIIQENNITHILSSFPPMADHHIAKSIKKKHPGIKWIADFRDLPADAFKKNVLALGWHQRKYRSYFRSADEIWAVSGGQAELLREQLSKPVRVIRNGIPEDLPLNTTAYQTGDFRISYTGSLYPYYPYDVLKEALILWQQKILDTDEIAFHYAGKDGSMMKQLLAEAGWSGKWVDHGQLSPKESWVLQQKSHINLLLSWHQQESKGILPAKTYEYLAARRPVLAIVRGGKDAELSELIHHYHKGDSQLCYTSEDAVAFLKKNFEVFQQVGSLELLGKPEELENLYFTVDF